MSIYPHDFINLFKPSGNRNNCFVLMPFAESFEKVYESIRRTCESPSVLFSCNRADDFYGAGHIMEDILSGIMSSDFIVADLTGKNPNVFYELGIVHSCKVASKVVIISQCPDDVPFDLRHMRYIEYKSDPAGLCNLSCDIERAFLSDLKDEYRFVVDDGGSIDFLKRLSGENRNFYTFTLSRLHIRDGAAKFEVTVHRESIVEDNITFRPDPQYIEVGGYRLINPTDWNIRLDRTEHSQAFFTVIRNNT